MRSVRREMREPGGGGGGERGGRERIRSRAGSVDNW